MARARLPRGLPSRLAIAAVAGLGVGAVVISAVMLWLLRGPVTLSRAEQDAIARARGTADTVPVITPPAPTPAPSPAAASAADSAQADVNLGIAPSIVGLSEAAARTLIIAAGFEVGSVSSAASDRPIGEVIATFPEAGERVPLPATINIILCAGPAARVGPDSVPPPDTLGTPRR
ncbi:MAG: PASTA domain-containing protein [Gemmatimonadaceae bacterium]|nr:PASTA domain-containing protein [Gemmatimonadaceae bacterium]